MRTPTPTFYNSLCYACHGSNGNGTPTTPGKTIAPPLSRSEFVLGANDPVMAIVLRGLQGPVNGTDYGAPMISMATYSDEDLANVLTFIRNSFGNRSDVVLPQDIAAARKKYPVSSGFWELSELEKMFPDLAIPENRFVHREAWKLSAGHRPETAPLAIDDKPDTAYLSKSTPYPGLWFQVQLPGRSLIKSIVIDSAGTEDAFPPGYDVRVSTDGENWSEPVARGNGEITTQIHLAHAVRTKFVRITLTKKNGWQPWAIHDLEFYGIEKSRARAPSAGPELDLVPLPARSRHERPGPQFRQVHWR